LCIGPAAPGAGELITNEFRCFAVADQGPDYNLVRPNACRNPVSPKSARLGAPMLGEAVVGWTEKGRLCMPYQE